MSPAAATTMIGAEVLEHLQAQIVSARRLLECILRQGVAVRAREVDGVLASMTEMMDAQRSFQLASKAVQMQDQLLQIANQVKS